MKNHIILKKHLSFALFTFNAVSFDTHHFFSFFEFFDCSDIIDLQLASYYYENITGDDDDGDDDIGVDNENASKRLSKEPEGR